VNDPAGEWFYDGYSYNSSFRPDKKGKGKVYSQRLISTAANTYSLRDALHAYDIWDKDRVESTATMWLHRISK
jgi:hypothetical protein